ncbi:MAG: hypothetical protein JWL83_2659 [Actinomycetia bacterium]|nr:hypothetical protein [Actinomycetes bacterium]
MKVIVVAALAIGLFTVGCDSNSKPSSTSPRSTVARVTVARPDCTTPSSRGAAANEIRGRATRGELWALVFGSLPLRTGEPTKFVWRMTGRGALHVALTAPDGSARRLLWGPIAHTAGSTFHRPGDEWGTGVRFDAAGCWRIHLARADTTGDVLVVVA